MKRASTDLALIAAPIFVNLLANHIDPVPLEKVIDVQRQHARTAISQAKLLLKEAVAATQTRPDLILRDLETGREIRRIPCSGTDPVGDAKALARLLRGSDTDHFYIDLSEFYLPPLVVEPS